METEYPPAKGEGPYLCQQVREEGERRRRQQRDGVLAADRLRLPCRAQRAVIRIDMLVKSGRVC